MILCPLMGAVTYIDNSREARTYRLPLLEKHGCPRELASRLQYAKTMVERLMTVKSSTGKTQPNVGHWSLRHSMNLLISMHICTVLDYCGMYLSVVDAYVG